MDGNVRDRAVALLQTLPAEAGAEQVLGAVRALAQAEPADPAERGAWLVDRRHRSKRRKGARARERNSRPDKAHAFARRVAAVEPHGVCGATKERRVGLFWSDGEADTAPQIESKGA